MKTDIHPKYFDKAKVTCGCGTTFVVGSTKEKIEVEICSACHPFYTGKQKVIDAAGKVEKFKARKAAAKGQVRSKREKLSAKAKKKKTAPKKK
ncbi:MAG: 50S ribosomal protein L31 [bacterium]|nr:50S ribosomal protein L31 [bacterium]